MIAAESLGVPLDAVSITPFVDTDLTTDTSGTFGSQPDQHRRSGHVRSRPGRAASRSSTGAPRSSSTTPRRQNQTLNLTADDVDLQDGNIVLKSDPTQKQPLAPASSSSRAAPILGRSIYTQDPQWERTAFAVHAAEVEVDTVTGSVSVTKYVAAHDVGRAINPFALEQQIEGGVVMSLGAALYRADADRPGHRPAAERRTCSTTSR